MERFQIKTNPTVDKKYTLTAGNIRFTVISDRILRVEKSRKGIFCDDATQTVLDRAFSPTPYSYRMNSETVMIKTALCEFNYSLKNKKMATVLLADGRLITDFTSSTLPGTARTLDMTWGAIPVGKGIISKTGVAILDDSETLIIKENGKIENRKATETDEYYFAFGFDYRGALNEFFKLTGFPPLIPRYALGNWWSRYKAYTQGEYEELMLRFKKEQIPLTVATIDMDWHWTDVTARFGKSARQYDFRNFMQVFYDTFMPGWTGYSWNTELFPNPQGFLNFLKENRLKITMNIHPATGLRPFEDCYDSFCENNNVEKGKHIKFDITDPKFIKGYFDDIHHPMEDDGVDFWWIDWQQGKNTKIKGLDPLWALNHYHYLDSCRDGKRGLILSRFAGAGSHRYPLGFSGDTAQTWAALNFQPYFTASATNIGYTWWSHDIGGHHSGVRDDELYLRWVQLGVFSPVNRLHSTANEFMGKEPWKYRGDVKRTATDFLRLRHRLIPYIYSMNYLTATTGKALIEPMYYEYGCMPESYTVPSQYMFGTELLVAPITTKASKSLNKASAKVWLPRGHRYTDIFTGDVYEGGHTIKMFRDTTAIPVLARDGAIIPLDCNDRENGCDNPTDMEIMVYRGNGEFTLWEDDGETNAYLDGKYASTKMSVAENGDSVTFRIEKPQGDVSVLPEKRKFIVSFCDITKAKNITVRCAGRSITPDVSTTKDGYISIALSRSKLPYDAVITLEGVEVKTSGSRKEKLIDLFSSIQGLNNPKLLLTKYVLEDKEIPLPKIIRDAITEIDTMI